MNLHEIANISSRKLAKILTALFALLLLVGSAQVTSSAAQSGFTTLPTSTGDYYPYPDYALSSLNTGSKITLGLLNSLTSGSSSVAAYERVIQQTLLPLNIRQVLLDISWQNYSIGQIPFEQWVSNWLTACNLLGVNNIFYVGQLTNSGVGSPWIDSLISTDRGTQTYNQNGQPLNYVSVDNPDVATALEKDLAVLNTYYGSDQSWVGIGTGYPSNDPYYSTNSSMPVMGYSNSTLQNFVNSIYFQRDVNGSGYLPNGQRDSLWTEFRSVPRSTVLSAGNWMTSTPYEVYGAGATQHYMSMRFALQANESSIVIQWYGNKVGDPGPLTLTVQNDVNGAPALNSVVANSTMSSAGVSSVTGWQSGVSLKGNFSAGFYWVLISSAQSDSNNYYNIYMRDYPIQGITTNYVLPIGSGQIAGSTILWLKSENGSNLEIYPYQNSYIPNGVQQFASSSTFSFNTVYLFLSDRIYNPTNATLNVLDLTTNKLVASGILSQQLVHGLQNWVPVALDQVVTTIPGNNYQLSISEPNSGYSWQTVLRGVTADPPVAGFQGQSQSWLFRLAMLDYSQGYQDFTAITTTGVDSVTVGHPDAMQFTVPLSSGSNTLSNISVLMEGGSGYYQNNVDLTVSIYANDPANAHPAGLPLKSVSVGGQFIPRSGWLNVGGFNLPLTLGGSYWAVFSTDSSHVAFPFARLVSPYNLNFLVSRDGGNSWVPPAEGPTELSFVANFSSGEAVGNFIDSIPTLSVAPNRLFAEPFIAKNSSEVIGVFLGPLGGSSSPNDFEMVSINPDNGRGFPSSNELGYGGIYSDNITLNYGLQFVQFSSAAHLKAGEKYWIVVHPINGSFTLRPLEYSSPPNSIPTNFTALLSSDGGYSWNKMSNDTTELSYLIASSPTALPSFSTAELFNDLSAHHNFSTTAGELRGWNAYIQSSELRMFSGVASWYQATTGRSFSFFTSAEPNLVNQLQLSDVAPLIASGSEASCTSLSTNLLANLDRQVSQFNEIASASVMQGCPNLLAMAKEMSDMRYLGTSYQPSSAATILVVGDGSTSNLTKYLSNAYRTDYVSLDNASSLSNYGNLSSFQAIVWSSTNASDTYKSVVTSYVDGGGTLIVVQQPPKWMSSLVGVDWSSLSTPGSQGQLTKGSQNELAGFVYHTQYSTDLKNYRVSNDTVIGQEGALSLGASQHGNGSVEFVYLGPTTAPTQMSEILVVLSNMISGSIAPHQSSPFWYGNSTSTGENIFYKIVGNGKSPLLVWVFNPSSNQEQISINLNGTFYGIGPKWALLSPSGFQLTGGTGSEIAISSQIAPYGWSAFYVVTEAPSLDVAYSTAELVRQLVYNGQGLYTLSASLNQSTIVFLSSSESPTNVSLDDLANITQAASMPNLLNSTQGWLYDANNHILVIKFISNGNDTLRVVLPRSAVAPSSSYVTVLAELSLVALVCAELILFSFLWFKRRR